MEPPQLRLTNTFKSRASSNYGYPKTRTSTIAYTKNAHPRISSDMGMFRKSVSPKKYTDHFNTRNNFSFQTTIDSSSRKSRTNHQMRMSIQSALQKKVKMVKERYEQEEAK